VNLAAVDEVENLHHDKGIVDECEVPRIDPIGVESSLIVRLASDGDHSARANSAPNHSIVPFVLRVRSKIGLIVTSFSFRNEMLSPEDQYQQHY
jgi:hypothetical protein